MFAVSFNMADDTDSFGLNAWVILIGSFEIVSDVDWFIEMMDVINWFVLIILIGSFDTMSASDWHVRIMMT